MFDDLNEVKEESPKKDFAEYVAIALRRRWIILISLFFCWLSIWASTWFIPSSYTSEALILVEQQKIPEQYVVPNVTVSLQDRLQNMTEQILSRTRLQATIERCHLYQDRRGPGGVLSAGNPVERMRKDIKIELVNSAAHPGQLTAFKVFYTAPAPALAQEVTSELTSLFIKEDLKVQQELAEGTNEFLESQLNAAKAKLEEQEAKVRTFKALHSGDLPSQAETNVQILSGLQGQLQSTQHGLDGAQQQKLYLESLLQQYESAHASVGGTDSQSPVSNELTTEIANLRMQLASARADHTEEHPDVVALRNKLAKAEKLKKDTDAENAAPTSAPRAFDPGLSAEVKRGSPTSIMQLQSQLKAINLEITTYQQHVKELEDQIGSYRSRLNMAPQTEQQLADVSRGYEESKANYNSLLVKQNQSQLATSLQEHQQGQQFRLLDPPNLPTKPSAPNRLLLSLGGLAAGAGLGIGLALLLEMKNAVVRKERDLHGLISVRVLVGIPHLPIRGEEKSRATLLGLEIVAVSVMAVLILIGNFFAYVKS